MEAMEIDSPRVLEDGNGGQPVAVIAAVDVNAPHVISDSGSSTEVVNFTSILPPAVVLCPKHNCSVNVCLCSRQGLRVHYPSQTTAPSRGFPDFLLRAPAASTAQPESGSTTEASESEEETEENPAELKALMAQTGRSSAPLSSSSSSSLSPLFSLSQRVDGSRTAQYSFSKAVLVSQAGGCRVLSYCEPLCCLLASQPSPHATLVPGNIHLLLFLIICPWDQHAEHRNRPEELHGTHLKSLFSSVCSGCGVKKVSLVNMKASQYVPIHSKQIRGLSFSRENNSLLLSASLDNTVKLTRYEHDPSQQPSCSCSPVQTFSAGSSCKLLTKNTVFRNPDGRGMLVCAGDEASNSTMVVWDAGSGSLLQRLPADLPVLDISPFSVNGENFLASLTEKMLKLYKWE
ncbi:hypothetical protein XENOCAPTIV_003599 [Xenoophorus captivus]|uniref:RING-type E3 ubiquitin transferase n=1 Tax=Xenoophorus captivus TaxID=1517983 RepID=A0ABV0R8F9_9TELE